MTTQVTDVLEATNHRRQTKPVENYDPKATQERTTK